MENSGYTKAHRAYELSVIAVAVGLAGVFAYRASHAAWGSLSASGLVVVALGLPGGALAADVVSGFIHWLFDTFGSEDTPVLGGLAIRTFREHHRLPKKMLEHDFIETNGHNIGLTIPLWLGGIWCLAGEGLRLAAGPFFVAWAILIAITSQIHKWAHMDVAPPFVQTLQRWGIILSPANHARHHVAPYTSHYCITTGWANLLWYGSERSRPVPLESTSPSESAPEDAASRPAE